MPTILIQNKAEGFRVSVDRQRVGVYDTFAEAYVATLDALDTFGDLELATFTPTPFTNITIRQHSRKKHWSPAVDGQAVGGNYDDVNEAFAAIVTKLALSEVPVPPDVPADDDGPPAPPDDAPNAEIRERMEKMAAYRGISWQKFVSLLALVVPDLFPAPPPDPRAQLVYIWVAQLHYFDTALHDELATIMRGCLPTQHEVEDECYYREAYRLRVTEEGEPAAWDWAAIARDTQAAFPHLYAVASEYY